MNGYFLVSCGLYLGDVILTLYILNNAQKYNLDIEEQTIVIKWLLGKYGLKVGGILTIFVAFSFLVGIFYLNLITNSYKELTFVLVGIYIMVYREHFRSLSYIKIQKV